MKYLSRRYFKFILAYVGIIFALSIVHWNGVSIFLNSSLAEAAGPSIGLDINNQGIRRAIDVQKGHEVQLFRIPGVVGVGTGIGANGQAIIKVFTVRAGILDIPQRLEEIPVEMKVTGMFVAYSDPKARFLRPVPIGVSTGHPAITAGTLGARVKDRYGNVYALSNNHVYANVNKASIGDPALQPGTFDGGDLLTDQIGTLWDYKEINGGIFAQNKIDAAIVLTTTDMVGNATPSDDGYGIPNSIIWGDSNSDGTFDNVTEMLDLPVKKFGRTTKLTKGKVSSINVTAMVCYDNCNTSDAWYAWLVEQIAITAEIPGTFSDGGDSGSLVVTDDGNNNPVGLLFAGSSTDTLANRIDYVLNEFEVSIDGSQSTIPANELCDNGSDDDGDGAIDCDDSDCFEEPVCQTEVENCIDGQDNDSDDLVDCEDPDCEDYCTTKYCFKGILDGNCNPKKEGSDCPDCLSSSQPDCLSQGVTCESDTDCCSEKCRGGKCR